MGFPKPHQTGVCGATALVAGFRVKNNVKTNAIKSFKLHRNAVGVFINLSLTLSNPKCGATSWTWERGCILGSGKYTARPYNFPSKISRRFLPRMSCGTAVAPLMVGTQHKVKKIISRPAVHDVIIVLIRFTFIVSIWTQKCFEDVCFPNCYIAVALTGWFALDVSTYDLVRF